MSVRHPEKSGTESVNLTDSVRARSTKTSMALAVLLGRDPCSAGDLPCFFAQTQKRVPGRLTTLAAAVQSWARRASAQRKRHQRSSISCQSAVDFASKVNSRFGHVPRFTVHPASPLHAHIGTHCCARHKKALCAGLLAVVLTTPSVTREGGSRVALGHTGVEITSLYAGAAAVPADTRIVLVLKHGLRGATALFGRVSTRANARNVATMTAGVRN